MTTGPWVCPKGKFTLVGIPASILPPGDPAKWDVRDLFARIVDGALGPLGREFESVRYCQKSFSFAVTSSGSLKHLFVHAHRPIVLTSKPKQRVFNPEVLAAGIEVPAGEQLLIPLPEALPAEKGLPFVLAALGQPVSFSASAFTYRVEPPYLVLTATDGPIRMGLEK